MTVISLLLMFLAIKTNTVDPAKLVYLSCNLVATKDRPVNHFDFTLDEQNGTVSFYVKQAGATNKEKAVFGPDVVTWTTILPFGKLVRTISRTDLSFREDLDIADSNSHQAGQCSVVEPPKRKF